MNKLILRPNILGFEVLKNEVPVTLYRAREELPKSDSPKPCFAPIYTPSGQLITEYRPTDHTWHTGLYFGWVHANDTNLWGGPWYIESSGKYEHVANSHGIQRHDRFTKLANSSPIRVSEQLTWLDGVNHPIAQETRNYTIESINDGYRLYISTRIFPKYGDLTLGASRAARYSGLELRMGPPFSDAQHYDSEGREGHESIMGENAKWVAARGARSGCVAILDHPQNPRYPTNWFTRRNLLGAGLLMKEDLRIDADQVLDLRYCFYVLDEDPGAKYWDREQSLFSEE
ncbi:MAG: PmoA family protein [Candidatus Latescibacterota bacterium]|nr:PmoA family protein [Candidatus Latescibacterota bacterium]